MISRECDNSLQRRRRPYWLLLALALFFAGQCLSVAHWHEPSTGFDADCGLCLFSSATGGAFVSTGWLPTAIVASLFLFCFHVPCVRRSAPRFHDSQAPPVLF